MTTVAVVATGPTAPAAAQVAQERRGRNVFPQLQQHQDHAGDEHPAQGEDDRHGQDLAVHQVLGLLLQFGVAAVHLLEPLVELLAAAQLGDQPAGPVGRLAEFLVAAGGQRRLDLLAERFGGLLAASWTWRRACRASGGSGASVRAGRRSASSDCGESDGIGPSPSPSCSCSCRRPVSAAAISAWASATWALEGGEPSLLLLEGLDPRGGLEQGLVEIQGRGVRAELRRLLLDLLHEPVTFLDRPR